MQSRTFRDIGPFDRAVGQLRAHFDALMVRETPPKSIK